MPITRSGYGTRGTTTQRGYGYAHRLARREAHRLLAQLGSVPCARRCGKPVVIGQPFDLDHTDDRAGYLGISHASCNRAHRKNLS